MKPTVTVIEIEEKLACLRKEWVGAKQSRRDIIRIQARALEIAREKLLKKQPQQKLV